MPFFVWDSPDYSDYNILCKTDVSFAYMPYLPKIVMISEYPFRLGVFIATIVVLSAIVMKQ